MPKPVTQAHMASVKNLKRSRHFLNLHREFHGGGRGAPRQPVRELPRGAVVFAIGTLDAYLSEVSAETLVKQFEIGHESGNLRDVLRRLQSQVPSLSLEVALIPDHAARLTRVRRSIVEHFYSESSHHGAKAINDTLKRLEGSQQKVWAELETRGWNKPARDLDYWTQVRHAIIHRGETPRVRRDKADTCVSLVRDIIDAVDTEALRTWM